IGVGPETMVGVSLERSAELIVALLGIWKAGGAYLPLDPDYPAERLGFMLRDAGARVVLTTGSLAERLAGVLAEDGARLVARDAPRLATRLSALPGEAIEAGERLAALTPATLAYVIYTSGSTGQPKGVEVDHGSLGSMAAAIGSAYGLVARDRMLQLASV